MRVACIAWLLAAWLGVCAPVAAETQAKTVVVLFDLSESARDYKQEYLEDFRLILDHINAGDSLLVTRIVKHPSAADALPVHLTLDAGKWYDNPKQSQQQRLLGLTRALMEAEVLLRDTDNTTPIVAVLEKVPRWMQAFPNPRRIVVLMSDMRESTRETADFDARGTWSPAALEAFMAKLEKRALIPDLAGARIYVAGARDKDEARLRAVRGFWQRYFEAAQADFASYRYDTRLDKFDECNEPDACRSRFFRDQREAPVRKLLENRGR